MEKRRPEYLIKEIVDSDDSDKIDAKLLELNKQRDDATRLRQDDTNNDENIPYAAISKAPRQFSSQFKVTIFPKRYNIELEREHFYTELVQSFQNIELIVSNLHTVE